MDIVTLKSNVKDLLLMKDRSEATEAVYRYIMKNFKIFTIRDDEKVEMWMYSNGIYTPNGKSYIREVCREAFDIAYTGNLANAVVAKVEAETYIDQKEFFNKQYLDLLPVQNGILNLKTRELLPFSKEYYFFNKLPVHFDKEADCPNIKKHFEEVLASKEDVKVMSEIFGFFLLKEYRFEKAIMFSGSGRNGKGKTLTIMKEFLGVENVANVPLTHLEKDLFSVGELFNKFANLSGDLSKTALKETGQFKSLTGRDIISAPRKFMTRVTFTNYAKMIFAANELPNTHDITHAFFNRWILIDFPYTFCSRQEYEQLEDKTKYKIADENIVQKMNSKKEMSGLLNWALEGLNTLLLQGSFSYSTTTEQVKNQWLRKSNSFTAFCMDCLEKDYDSKITKKNLKAAYLDYCKLYDLELDGDKVIKDTLTKNWGASSARERIGDVDRTYWDGLKYRSDMGVMDDMGFYCYSQISKTPIGANTHVTCDSRVKPNKIVTTEEQIGD